MPHLRFLDGLRGLAALYVVVHHIFAEISPSTTGQELPRKIAFLLRPLAFGHLAVGVFIVLSGFVLMLPIVCRPEKGLGSGGVIGFVLRRARRIVPPYWAALFASLGLIAVFPNRLGVAHNVRWDVALPVWNAPNIGSHIVLLHNFWPDALYKINPPFWSIAVEWQIYFVFALLLFPLWKQHGLRGAGFFAALFGLGPHFLLPPETNGDWFCPWYLLLFWMGMAAAQTAFGSQSPPNAVYQAALKRRSGMVAVCFVVAVLATTVRGVEWWSLLLLPSDLVLGAAAAAFLVFASAEGRIASAQNRLPMVLVSALQSRPLLALGAFSYSLYLVHFPLLSLVHSFLRPHFASAPLPSLMRFLALLLLGLPLCLLVAYGFYWSVERPFLRARTVRRLEDPAEKRGD